MNDKAEAEEVPRVRHKWNVADAITAIRIVCAALILFCPAFSVPFYAVYLLGAFSDMVDGWVARKRNLKSSFGAKLDAIADCAFVIAVLTKILPTIYVPKWLWIWTAAIAFLKLTNLASGLAMRRRLVSMHTAMNKVTGFLLFLLPFGIGRGSCQALTIAEIVACASATFAAIQEGHYIRAGKEIE